MSRVAAARAGFGAGVVAASSGVGEVFGLGWGLIVGGVAMAASFLLLFNVDETP